MPDLPNIELIDPQLKGLLEYSFNSIQCITHSNFSGFTFVSSLFGDCDSFSSFCDYYQDSGETIIFFHDNVLFRAPGFINNSSVFGIFVPHELRLSDNRMTAKFFKVFAPLIFANYCSRIAWMDANLRISPLQWPFNDRSLLKSDKPFIAVFKHRTNRTVILEAIHVFVYGKESILNILRLFTIFIFNNKYRNLFFFKRINWCGLIFFDSVSPQFSLDWWFFIIRGSVRDQLSFPCLRKYYNVVLFDQAMASVNVSVIGHVKYEHYHRRSLFDLLFLRLLGVIRK